MDYEGTIDGVMWEEKPGFEYWTTYLNYKADVECGWEEDYRYGDHGEPVPVIEDITVIEVVDEFGQLYFPAVYDNEIQADILDNESSILSEYEDYCQDIETERKISQYEDRYL